MKKNLFLKYLLFVQIYLQKEGEEVGAVIYRADTHCVLFAGAASRTPNGRGFYYYYIYRLTHDQTPPKGPGLWKGGHAKKYEVTKWAIQR